MKSSDEEPMMESGDEEPVENGPENGIGEDLNSSQASLDETRAIYQGIKTDLVEASNINATFNSNSGSAESQLNQDIGKRILETSKKFHRFLQRTERTIRNMFVKKVKDL